MLIFEMIAFAVERYQFLWRIGSSTKLLVFKFHSSSLASFLSSSLSPFFLLSWFALLFEPITLIHLFITFIKCLLCADTVLCNGDSVVSKTEKVPVLMELTFWWRKTDKTQGDKQDNFR